MAVKTVQAIINGVTTTLTYNSTSKKYEATITAPSTSSYNNNDGHYYPVTVKATDEAGNTTTKNDTDATLGASLKLQVKEKVAPIITITYPTASALITNNKPTITWKVTDDDSGVNSGSIKVTIDTGAAITAGIIKTAVTGGYECTYTPTTALADGSHTIKIDASDNDGNAATQKTVTFKVDTVPPTLSVTAPVAGLITNKAACTVTGTTNDITSSPVTVTIKLNSGSAEAVTVGADGSFSKSLTLASGNNTITIVATDSAGKSSTVTRTVTLDTTAPTIKSVTLMPNPVDAGKTYVISVEVTD
ncbi:Ig-like domain-containing protein [Hungatella hathewayi]|uniref:Ig-like domain-containing protein n=1 Tax=Hungatella hathewayi TaxID=154046 RepID=UPI00210877E2|nr:Ig-like domain-containing protein [Hungatella hathewayi]MCQ5384279.1 Ig-like domain-containing protein [Hungatella hathewayi]